MLSISITEVLAVVTAMGFLGESLSYVQTERHLIISLSCIVYPVVTAVLFYLLRGKREMFSIPNYDRVPLIGMLVVDLLFVILAAWFWHFSAEMNMTYEEVLMLVLMIVFFVILFSFIIFLNMIRKSKEQAELKLRLQQSEMQNQLNEELSSITDKLRRLRHDMNNHIGVLKGFAKYQAYDDLEQLNLS